MSRGVVRAGHRSQEQTALVLRAFGDTCHLCGGPGATTRDHLLPVAYGGLDDLSNMRPAHKSCNSKRGARHLPGQGPEIVYVVGPPGGGKSTWAREQARPGDVIVDLDVLAAALGPGIPEQQAPAHLRHVALGARQALIRRLTRCYTPGFTGYIIHAIPSPENVADWRFMGYRIKECDPGQNETRGRVIKRGDRGALAGVTRWYQQWPLGVGDVPAARPGSAGRRPAGPLGSPTRRVEPSRDWFGAGEVRE